MDSLINVNGYTVYLGLADKFVPKKLSAKSRYPQNRDMMKQSRDTLYNNTNTNIYLSQ